VPVAGESHFLLAPFARTAELSFTDGFFYRAMHYSAKRSLAIACRLSVRLSVCDVGGS